MAENPRFYYQETTGIKYHVGDLYGYPDSLIRARTGAVYAYSIPLLEGTFDRVLDFGSGRGHGVKAIRDGLAPKTVVSLDKYRPYLVAQSIALNEDEPQNPYQFLNASTDLPFANGVFDAVFFMHVVEHLKDPARLMGEIRRVLTPNGKLIVATPDERNLVGNSPYDEHVFTDTELSSLLQASGFKSEFFYVVANNKAMRVHERKKWLATHASFTGNIRNHANPDFWDAAILRSGISLGPLGIQDFSLSRKFEPNAIDIMAIASVPNP